MDDFIKHPDWLPSSVVGTYYYIRRSGNMTKQEAAFFTDQRLADFWSHVDIYLEGVGRLATEKLINLNYDEDWLWLLDRKENAVGTLVGCFINGLDLYTTKRGISKKTNIRKRQREADTLIQKAADLSIQLAETLSEIEDTTTISPDELWFLELCSRLSLLDDDISPSMKHRWGYTKTSQVIFGLGEILGEFPTTDEQFSEIAGMASQKSTWRDWLRCAYDLIQQDQARFESSAGPLTLREKHWVALVQVLFGISNPRDSVHNALNKIQKW